MGGISVGLGLGKNIESTLSGLVLKLKSNEN